MGWLSLGGSKQRSAITIIWTTRYTTNQRTESNTTFVLSSWQIQQDFSHSSCALANKNAEAHFQANENAVFISAF